MRQDVSNIQLIINSLRHSKYISHGHFLMLRSIAMTYLTMRQTNVLSNISPLSEIVNIYNTYNNK